MGIFDRFKSYSEDNGMRYAVRRAGEKAAERVNRGWDKTWRLISADDETLQRQRDAQPDAGLISVAIPVYNTDPDMLLALAESLTAQTYQRWEACMFVAGDSIPTEEALSRIAGMDPRLRILHGSVNEGIAGNTNHAVGMSMGDWVALCDHDDLLPPEALWMVASEIAKGDADVIYTDEDRIDPAGRVHSEPHLKPDFAPDTLRSMNYICHLMAVRRTLLEEVGGERTGFDGSQDHDLALRLAEKTARFRRVPVVGYHWRIVENSVSHLHADRCLEASARAVAEHMERTGWYGTAEPYKGVLRLRYELRDLAAAVFVTAASEQEALPCVKALKAVLPERVTVAAAVGADRFAAMNRAAARSDAALIMFVDASVRGFTPGFFEELAMYAQRTDVGMVTPMLVNGSGRITHAGFIVNASGGLRCRNQGLPREAGGHYRLNHVSHNVGAVSPACFMVRRSEWLPLDPAYHTAFATADACMAMNAKGLHHVFTPHAQAVCTGPEELLLLKEERNADDRLLFNRHWGDTPDPCWNPLLRNDRGDLSPRRMDL